MRFLAYALPVAALFALAPSGYANASQQCIEVPAQCRMSSPWGNRFHPVRKVMVMHRGIDLACPVGTPIKATHDGQGSGSFHYGGGNIVIVDAGNGSLKTKYMHNSFLAVPTASRTVPVARGQEIARSGNTGQWTTGPHLHFEVWFGERHVDPAQYFCDSAARQSIPPTADANPHGDGTQPSAAGMTPGDVKFVSEPPPTELSDGTLMETLSTAVESRFMNPSWQAMIAAEQDESRLYAEIAFMRALSMAAKQRRATAENYMLSMLADLQVLKAGKTASNVEKLRMIVTGGN